MTTNLYDVLIVGAGPVGLATAIALYRHGIKNILVIDRTSEFRRVGQGVDLLPNGLKALKYIDELAYMRVKEAGGKFLNPPSHNNPDDKASAIEPEKLSHKRAWNHKNLQGKILRSIPLDFETWFNRYGEGRVFLTWFDLQTILRNLLPQEIVRANHRCVNVTQDGTWTQISCAGDRAPATNPFAHWEMHKSEPIEINSTQKFTLDSTQKNFRAKLVIGADGINSTIRQVLYNHSDLSQWAKPQYSDFSAIGCLQIDNVPDEIIQELESKYFQGDRIITLSNAPINSDSQYLEQPRIILIRQQENTLGYLLHAPLSLDSLLNKSAKEKIELAVNVLEKANVPPIFTRLVNLSVPKNLFSRPYYIHPANISIDSKPIWSSGRIVLVGDAAHGMPPFAAQGVNQGFEDAALIATAIAKIIDNKALDDEKTIFNEFSKYEQIRRPFMMKIQEATMKNHVWSQQQWEDYSEMVYSRKLQQSIGNLA
ncbi:NAD(P)/FAD-dependent oxidoreductase [Pleurocapsa sp. PCC 7327]|uniref:FAD-dependent oxidoreductase n=1 Tax=Pleurocapsa sp. PCC 7327 TaxID=118163 RepID=UPI000313CD02|nr:NAD(P)/FAD-dependent oxidoreductase [Pleurocapsa sp. PCC 7327]